LENSPKLFAYAESGCMPSQRVATRGDGVVSDSSVARLSLVFAQPMVEWFERHAEKTGRALVGLDQ
jgi:hypothetical protein